MYDRIWNSEKIESLMKQVRRGNVPRNNPFWESDVSWRKKSLIWEYTDEEKLEIARITEDIVYFAEKYCRVQTDAGYRYIKLFPFQKRNLLQLKKYRYSIWLASRQTGKCVTYDTKVKIYVNNILKNIPYWMVYYKNAPSNLMNKIEQILFGALYFIKSKILEA